MSPQANNFEATQPAPLSTITGRAIDEFRVDHPEEVLALLRRLVASAVLVQLSAPGGAAYTSTLWAVDAPGRRTSPGLNVAQSSTISLKRSVVMPVSGAVLSFV